MMAAIDMDQFISLVEKLKGSAAAGDQGECLDKLRELVSGVVDDEEDGGFADTVTDSNVLDNLMELLIANTDSDVQVKTAQLLAELAKMESLREPLVERGFVPPLLDCLKSSCVSLATQGCRALGNICYENDAGRNEVDGADGMETLIKLLTSHLDNKAEGADRLRTVACGFLLNLTNTHEPLQEKALENDVLTFLERFLTKNKTDEGLMNMALLTLSSLSDSDMGKVRLADSSLVERLVELLGEENAKQHYDTITEILINVSDGDDMKTRLAKTPLCQYLINIVRTLSGKSGNEEEEQDNQHKIKVALDLLISLLMGDPSMAMLFNSGQGPVYRESITWLGQNQENLKISGALAVGNFARRDDFCSRLVDDGVVDRLVAILRQPDVSSNTPLQYAVLSALRNLAIPTANKPRLLAAGVVPAALNSTAQDALAVVFKLLGLLRMLVDGQEAAAKLLGEDAEFMNHLVEWCDVEEHAGVKGEATRLLAWLVKHGKTESIMRGVIQAAGLSPLVDMVISEHIVMQNEAIFALTLIASVVLSEAEPGFDEAGLASTLAQILQDKTTVADILCNALTLTRILCASEGMREKLSEAGVFDIVRGLSNHEDARVKTGCSEVLNGEVALLSLE